MNTIKGSHLGIKLHPINWFWNRHCMKSIWYLNICIIHLSFRTILYVTQHVRVWGQVTLWCDICISMWICIHVHACTLCTVYRHYTHTLLHHTDVYNELLHLCNMLATCAVYSACIFLDSSFVHAFFSIKLLMFVEVLMFVVLYCHWI